MVYLPMPDFAALRPEQKCAKCFEDGAKACMPEGVKRVLPGLVKEYKEIAKSMKRQGLHEANDATGVAETLENEELFALVVFARKVPGFHFEPSVQEILCWILRDRESIGMDSMMDFLCYLSRGLHKLSPLVGTAYVGVFRAGREKLTGRRYMEGSEICWPTFRSLLLCPFAAREAAGDAGVLLRFHVRSACRMTVLGLAQAIMLPNARFKVMGKLTFDQAIGCEILDLQEIDDAKDTDSDGEEW
jgi:hypothetical protein